MILNETSYFGAGCRETIAVEAMRRGFKKAFFVTDKDLIRFKVADKIIEVFEQTLNDIGAVITESLRFPDHHDYTEEEIRDVMHQAEEQGAEAIIITDKDAVKIPETLLCKKRPIPIYIISIEVTFIDETQVLFEYLKEKLPRLKG